MLFRTVYGPELEAIYRYVIKRNAQGVQPKREEVHVAFISRQPDGSPPSTQSVDDALAFLTSARMVEETDGYRACAATTGNSFAVQVFRAMRRIEQGESPPDHPIDPLYTLLLTELFIKPDRLFVSNVHAEANQLWTVEEAGGLGKEKIAAWKRVMAFLSVGRRVAGGFQCAYSPTLLKTILTQWDKREGDLQSFLEDCFDQILPYARADGGLAQAARAPLGYLASQGQIDLFSLQDSPTRSYFGHRRYKGIAWRKDVA